MSSGELINPMILWTNATALNEYGDTIETPTNAGIVWCGMTYDSGTEGESFDAVSNSNSVTLTCRYQSNIKNNSYFTLGARQFNIVSVNNVNNRNRELIIKATEVLVV